MKVSYIPKYITGITCFSTITYCLQHLMVDDWGISIGSMSVVSCRIWSNKYNISYEIEKRNHSTGFADDLSILDLDQYVKVFFLFYWLSRSNTR